jgi:hypothetical protein
MASVTAPIAIAIALLLTIIFILLVALVVAFVHIKHMRHHRRLNLGTPPPPDIQNPVSPGGISQGPLL